VLNMIGAAAQCRPLPKSLLVLAVQSAKNTKLQDSVVGCLYRIAGALNVSVSAMTTTAAVGNELMSMLLHTSPFPLAGKEVLQPLSEVSCTSGRLIRCETNLGYLLKLDLLGWQ
jgi:hypothetical protein